MIARVQPHHGEPAIMVDGQVFPPMMMTVQPDRPEYLKKLRDAGIRIFFLSSSTRWIRPGGTTDPDTFATWQPEGFGEPKIEPDGITKTVSDIEKLLSAVPDAYIVLRLNTSPPKEWINSHPDDMVTYNDGSHRPLTCSSVGIHPIHGMHSICSEAWRHDGDEALKQYCDEIRRSPHFDRVIGFFLCAAGTCEWYYPDENPITDYENGKYADCSPAFRAEFGRILREKYGTVEKLRKAWNDPTATFDHPKIPDLEERRFTEIDEVILDYLLKFESLGHNYLVEVDRDAKAPTNLGVFLNANDYRHVADFYSALHEGIANTIVHFAGTIKSQFPNLLCGAFYGSLGCTKYFQYGTATGTLPILDCPDVDFLAAPGNYVDRVPGGVTAQREMQDSFRLRNMIFIVEDDSRTHRVVDFYRDSMGLYDKRDTAVTLKRDFARDLCDEIQGWWFDMCPGGGWYEDDETLELFRRQQDVARYAYSLDRKKHNEIAVICDTDSVHYVSQNTSELVLDLYRVSDLHRIGAPVDWYFHDDLARDDMPDYKMYLMLNLFCLSECDREAIKRKARKNNATVVWLYAPGFIDPDSERAMRNENITATTGIKVARIDETKPPRFRISGDHPAVANADPDALYGFIDRYMHHNYWLSNSVVRPPFANPYFFIDDEDAEVLGRYVMDGRPALAVKDDGGYQSVYCCAHVMRWDLLASIAAWSGVHLFADHGDVLYANENFVAIHADGRGKRTIRFKKKCSPFEVYEKQYYGQGVNSIEVEMRHGDTLMFSLNGEC